MSRPTPFSVDAVLSSSLLIAAPSPQQGYVFKEWVHGGERAQSIAVSAPRLIQAVFEGGDGAPNDPDAGAGICEGMPMTSAGEAGCGCRLPRARLGASSLPAAGALVLIGAWRRRRRRCSSLP
jgi:hypothetical protein